jgi:argininosuccinate lyase
MTPEEQIRDLQITNRQLVEIIKYLTSALDTGADHPDRLKLKRGRMKQEIEKYKE